MSRNTVLTAAGHLALAGWVTALDENEIFVFGSNAGGAHAGGAARIAYDSFGAVWGEGHGMHGQTYAIDTMTDEPTMAAEIASFLEFAAEHPNLIFLVTEIGCGIGPYEPSDVAPYFAPVMKTDGSAGLANIALPESFLAVLNGA